MNGNPQQQPQELEYIEAVQHMSASELLFQVQFQQHPCPHQVRLKAINLGSQNSSTDRFHVVLIESSIDSMTSNPLS